MVIIISKYLKQTKYCVYCKKLLLFGTPVYFLDMQTMSQTTYQISQVFVYTTEECKPFKRPFKGDFVGHFNPDS